MTTFEFIKSKENKEYKSKVNIKLAKVLQAPPEEDPGNDSSHTSNNSMQNINHNPKSENKENGGLSQHSLNILK